MCMSNLRQGPPSTPLHSVSVAGVVVREDGRVLTIKLADNGTWEPPGGVLELAEAPEDGVRREVFEETGVKVEVDRLTPDEVTGRMAEVYAVRVTDALLDGAPQVRAHDGRRLA
ncbi:NUDIX domain-containing protein [Streptomyces fimicarius]|uniref:NUDIX domain-containing protein n=1 Tax=Streptomyces griseus TaxID=1911 RepID=UPI0036E609BF